MKKKVYKPEAFFLIEGAGIMTKSCGSKEVAIKAMTELLDNDDEYGGDVKVNKNTVIADRAFWCKKCQTFTLGENICWECNEDLPPTGRLTYRIYFPI